MKRIRPNVKIISRPFTFAPAVDVFFLLLIFFMISSSVTFWPGTKVETEVKLPRARTYEMMAAQKLIITITSSGDLFFNSKPMRDIEELERELSERVRQNTNVQPGEGDGGAPRTHRPMIVLRADRRNPYERIIQIESLARDLNLDVYHLLDPSGRRSDDAPILYEDAQ
jgi:biopolymer transport protein ExbD